MNSVVVALRRVEDSVPAPDPTARFESGGVYSGIA